MEHEHHSTPSFWRSPAGIALAVAVTIGAFYLLTEHQAHVFGVLPYLLILACPLTHVFMHRGHGGHSGHHHSDRRPDDEHPQ